MLLTGWHSSSQGNNYHLVIVCCNQFVCVVAIMESKCHILIAVWSFTITMSIYDHCISTGTNQEYIIRSFKLSMFAYFNNGRFLVNLNEINVTKCHAGIRVLLLAVVIWCLLRHMLHIYILLIYCTSTYATYATYAWNSFFVLYLQLYWNTLFVILGLFGSKCSQTAQS